MAGEGLSRRAQRDVIDLILSISMTPPVVSEAGAPPLPDGAPAIYRDRADKGENIITFLKRVWGPWLEARVLTRRDLRRLDPSADGAVVNWLRHSPFPDDIYLPTLKDSNDQLAHVLGGDAVVARHRRLGDAMRMRRQRSS